MSSLSIKRAHAILEGDSYLEDLELNGGPKSQIFNETTTMLQVDAQNTLPLLSSSIKKGPNLFGKDYMPELLQKHDKIKPQIAIKIVLPLETTTSKSHVSVSPLSQESKNSIV